MRSQEEVRTEVYSVIHKQLPDAKDIRDDSHLSAITQDSIQLFELLLAFEKFYEVETNYEDVAQMETVADVITYVQKLLN